MSAAAYSSASSSPRRSDSNVALGLFSKVTAARKEKLSLFAKDTASDTLQLAKTEDDTNNARTNESISSCFPEITDSNSHTYRHAPARIPPHVKKVTPNNFAQNLRWTKQRFSEISRTDQHGSVTTLPTRRHRSSISPVKPLQLHAGNDRRQTIIDSSRIGSTKDPQLASSDSAARPSTASNLSEMRRLPDPTFSDVRGFVRRPAPEAINSSLESASSVHHLRWGNLAHSNKPKTAQFEHGLNGNAILKTTAEGSSFNSQPSTAPQVSKSTDPSSDQELYFAETAEIPGIPIIYRNSKHKATNQERLNLDRRNLPVVPLLEGEQMLRLLNLQNNSIRQIDNLLGLPNLIFLDLYNNCIEKLENLHAVLNLRVLMLGKNRLRVIENLDCLKKLDVLDLHSNEIEKMENLNELKELRVLNLGGNKITTLENIEKLTLLAELNLRRNQIENIGCIGKLPSLQRLFLSNNKLKTLEALDPLLQVTSIIELRLDGNIVCESNQTKYRSLLIFSFPSLKHLDLKTLSDTERNEAIQYFTPVNVVQKKRDDAEEIQRAHVISCIKTLWENRPSKSGDDTHPKKTDSSNIFSTCDGTRKSFIPCSDHKEQELQPTSREDPMIHNNNCGYSEIEVHGDNRVLVIYGDALQILESTKVHSIANAITFRYVSIEKIITAGTAASNSNLKLFARLRRLNFAHNDLYSFEQLMWLATLGTKVEEMFISDNPICAKSLLKLFVAARLTNTLRLNGEEISATDRQIGKQMFPKTTRQRSSELSSEPLIKTKDRESMYGKQIRQRLGNASTPGIIVGEIVEIASEMEQKAAALDEAWEDTLYTIVKETLLDIERRNSAMSGCLDGL